MRYLIALSLFLFPAIATGQYTPQAGKSAPASESEESKVEKGAGIIKSRRQSASKPKKVTRDKYGNAGGEQYDLVYDGTFEGQTIVVVFLVPWGTFENAEKALRTKGFGVVTYKDVPSVKELKNSLKKANQFWLVSSCGSFNGKLTEKHATAVKNFYDSGRGVYLWGDNKPCYEEANFLSKRVFDIYMEGDVPGDKVVSFRTNKNKSGLLRDHMLSTGIEQLYEGVTVATIKTSTNASFKPFLWGSAGNIIAAYNEVDKKRAIIDGGMTRLYNKWDTAGTGRYVVNAASWLANYERFGDSILSKAARKKSKTTP